MTTPHAKPRILISFPFVEGGGAWHIPLGAACSDALCDMGFEVEKFNPVVEARNTLGKKILERFAVIGGRMIGLSKAETKSRLPWLEDAIRFKAFQAKALEFQPDYLFVISTFTYPERVLAQIKSVCQIKASIGWCVEGPTWIGNPNREAALYDHYFCIHQCNITQPKIQFMPAVGFDPRSYRKTGNGDKTHDLVFVGREKKRRVQWLAPMQNMGLEIFGPAWDHTPLAPLQVSTGIFGNDLNALYNQSKIVLNVSAWANDQMDCLNLRILDVPATGSFLLTDYAPGIEEYLVPDKEVVIAYSPEEMRDKAQYYLSHDAARERIAQAGWEKVQKLETYPQKMRKMLNACDLHPKA